MTANRILNFSHLRLCGMTFILAATLLVSVSAAQETKTEAKLVPGAEVSLSAVKAADWIQGEGPTAFEPGKVYIFESVSYTHLTLPTICSV